MSGLPQITILIRQQIREGSSDYAEVRKEISLASWERSRMPGIVAERVINEALAELSQHMKAYHNKVEKLP